MACYRVSTAKEEPENKKHETEEVSKAGEVFIIYSFSSVSPL